MKNAIFLLCLALVAGGAFANLAPMASQDNKLAAAGPIELSDASLAEPGDLKQGNSCPGTYYGQCANITFTPGDCDCDTPAQTGNCDGFNGRPFEVFTCYGTILCYQGAYCPP